VILFTSTVYCTDSTVNVVSYGSKYISMCVRVIMRVVYCSLDCKQFVL